MRLGSPSMGSFRSVNTQQSPDSPAIRRSVCGARLWGKSVTWLRTMAVANPTRKSYRLDNRFRIDRQSGRESARSATSERNSPADRGPSASQASASSGPYGPISGAFDITPTAFTWCDVFRWPVRAP